MSRQPFRDGAFAKQSKKSLGFDELLVPSTEKGVEVVRGIHPAELPKH